MAKKFPDDSTGAVWGPDGEARPRTRAHTLAGFNEPVEGVLRHAGRNQAFIDEESAWLNRSAHFEE